MGGREAMYEVSASLIVCIRGIGYRLFDYRGEVYVCSTWTEI
jgi:hypothetical protein